MLSAGGRAALLQRDRRCDPFLGFLYEMRYFYDQTHFRNCVGDMALARIFSDHTVYVPEDFGVLVTPGNAEAHIDAIYQSGPAEETDVSAVVPTLLYHSISPEGDNGNGMVVSPETFEQQIAALSAGGYTAVSLEQVQDYVRSGEPLPEKPILITFDDGYQDNYTYAFPVLKKYHMQATVFVIGVQVGNKTYKGTDYPITPHLTDRQMKTMAASGLISFQTHSYDMHQSSAYEEGRARIDMLQFEGEDEQAYIDLLKSDLKAADEQIAGISGKEPIALAYPRGAYSELAATVVAQSGIAVTFTTEPGANVVLKGVPQSLYGMHRRFVYEKTTPEQLLSYCSVARG